MKNWKVIGTLILAGVPALAWSGDRPGENFVVEAPVIQAEPLVRIVDVSTPREICWDEPVQERTNHPRSAAPVVAGGVIGGVIGNAIGDRRHSRRALTAVGALLGASVGYQHANRHARPSQTYVTTQRVCEIRQTVHQEERIDGYRVTYEYRGRTFVTHTATDPGPTIPVTVSVQPVTYNEGCSPAGYPGRTPYRQSHHET